MNTYNLIFIIINCLVLLYVALNWNTKTKN